ncbi:hypothetical protein T4E_7507 [Trichinella pseudospiralis]|uniref:Uncharacterized protein n=1 Tax=Trichinella pseudospiralis TaxID=6337 RepID=A0A0V0XN80_TRIPS|nr:hypothetical protein T4E_7507 [Trichinella pseudospiralis]
MLGAWKHKQLAEETSIINAELVETSKPELLVQKRRHYSEMRKHLPEAEQLSNTDDTFNDIHFHHPQAMPNNHKAGFRFFVLLLLINLHPP